ncbi:MAG: leucine-rich repeat protein [Oscillospiraceae bacterium]|jgi:hypothetical protein|nr:leucine-rich repeat protein [Oscillospiraceae bacterium]
MKKTKLAAVLASALLLSSTVALSVPMGFFASTADTYEDFEYTVDDNKGGAVLTKYLGASTDVELPDEIDGIPLVGISGNAFTGTGIETLSIPSNVEYIDTGVFSTLFTLKTLAVADDSRWYWSDGNALYSKGYIGEDSAPSPFPTTLLKYLPNASGVDYTVPDGVTQIADFAFTNNKNLINVTLPESAFVFTQNIFVNSDRIIFWVYEGSLSEVGLIDAGFVYETDYFYIDTNVTEEPKETTETEEPSNTDDTTEPSDTNDDTSKATRTTASRTTKETAATSTMTAPPSGWLKGDVDGNGTPYLLKDLITLKKVLAGHSLSAEELASDYLYQSDVDNYEASDGSVDILDVVYIQIRILHTS